MKARMKRVGRLDWERTHKTENYDAINNVITTTYLLLQLYDMRTTSVLSVLFRVPDGATTT